LLLARDATPALVGLTRIDASHSSRPCADRLGLSGTAERRTHHPWWPIHVAVGQRCRPGDDNSRGEVHVPGAVRQSRTALGSGNDEALGERCVRPGRNLASAPV